MCQTILPSVVLLPLTCPTLAAATGSSSKIQTLSTIKQRKRIRTIFTAVKVVGSETKYNKGALCYTVAQETQNIFPKILSKNVKNFVVRRQLDQQKAKERNGSETVQRNNNQTAQRSDNQSWTQIDSRITRAARTPTVRTQITVQTNFPNVPTKIRPENVYVDSILGLPTGTPTSTPTSVPSRLVRRQQRVDQYQRQRVN